MSTAVISFGPKLGLLNNATIGEQYYDQFRPFLRGVDALTQASFINFAQSPPVTTPADGDAYIVIEGTGDWLGKDNQIAVWSTQVTQDGTNNLVPGWDYYTPKSGWIISNLAHVNTQLDPADRSFIYFNGVGWTSDGNQNSPLNNLIVSNSTGQQGINILPGMGFSVLTAGGAIPNTAGIAVNAGIIGGNPPGLSSVDQQGYLNIGAMPEVITTTPYVIGTNDIAQSTSGVSYVFDCTGGDIEVGLPQSLGGFNGNTNIFMITRRDSVPGTNHVLRITTSGSTGSVNGAAEFDIPFNFGGALLVGSSEFGTTNNWTAIACTKSVLGNSGEVFLPSATLAPGDSQTLSFVMVGVPLAYPVIASPTSGALPIIGIVVDARMTAPQIVTVRRYNAKPPADDHVNDILVPTESYYATAVS